MPPAALPSPPVQKIGVDLGGSWSWEVGLGRVGEVSHSTNVHLARRMGGSFSAFLESVGLSGRVENHISGLEQNLA